MMVKETILTALKDSGDILKEDWLPKVESERKDCLCTWLNMFGSIIIEMIVFNYRKNSFLINLKGSMFSGSFGTLPDRKSTRLNSSHIPLSRMPSSA